jgi:SagB-type dehydrogenase family enzyme
LDIYLIANDVDSLPPGSYFFHRQRQGLETLGQGDFRAEAGHLCFEQALGADASAVLFLMADLGPVLGRYGNRGYRAAQLEAGIVGGKVYLGVYSLGLGATGLTFYDDDVSEFFAPHSAGKSVLFVVALGHTHQLNRVRPFRSRVAAVLDTMARSALKGPEG